MIGRRIRGGPPGDRSREAGRTALGRHTLSTVALFLGGVAASCSDGGSDGSAGLDAGGSPQASPHGLPPATAAKRPTLAELVQRSQHVVAGEVVATRASWTADGRRIFTTVTLRVERRLKGAAEDGAVRFRHLGGTVGNISLSVSHVPHFEIGETVLVFLRDQVGELPAVVEGDAGKRQILMDGDGSWRLLPHPLDPVPAEGNPSIRTVEDLAAIAAGTDPEAARVAAARTTAFYLGSG